MSYPIEQIVGWMKARREGSRPARISWLLTDSRSLCFPEETLFFALTSKNNDGHRYIPDLYARGVKDFVVSRLPQNMSAYEQANFLVVDNTLTALQALARSHRARFTGPVVGITGSNGKTIIKEWLYQLLAPDRVVTRSPRSYNSQVGVPLSVWGMDEKTQVAIFEAGISQPGEMERLYKIIRPTIGIISNISGAHQENFSSLEEKCLEKLHLFKECEVVIYNGDNPIIAECMQEALPGKNTIAWSRKDESSPLFIKKIEKGEQESCIHYVYQQGEYSYTIPFVDEASVENSINCLAASLFLGTTPAVLAVRMARLEPIAMRLEVKDGKRGCILINDSYNSDIASLDIALDFMERRSGLYHGRKRTLILSDFMETGQTPASLYRTVAQYVEKRGIEKFIGIGTEIAAVAGRLHMECYFFTSTDDFLNSSLFAELENELILIKGSRRYQFDRITEQLEQKVHETILEINLSALRANFNRYRSMLKPTTKITCMVKAEAYGAGPYEVARTLQDCHVDYLAVAVADEGEALRKAGITTNIMIMDPELTAFKTMFDNELEPEVYSFNLLEEMIKAAEREGITNYPIHIKIDTGMHRLGFMSHEIPQLIARLQRQTALLPRSVFSHFVGSDSDRFDDFSQVQIARFEEASTALQAAFPHHILRHLCNTAGIERFPQVQYDMVRLGLGLYGINPIDNGVLQNVSTLKSTILQIHEVPKEETVGYSRKGVLKRDSRIAAIPIGYADGLDRHLGNRAGYCLVKGKRAPYVGNICMDVCMIDVTDIDCKEGDMVEIFGDHLPVSVLSDILGTIPYEILTSVSSRVKRIYFSD